MPPQLSEFDRGRLVGMLEAGKPVAWVAAQLHIHRKTVMRWWNRYEVNGAANRQKGSGRPRAATASQERRLCLTVKRNRFTPVSRLYCPWSQATGVNISCRTAQRIVNRGGLRCCRPLVRIPLSLTHRHLRLQWANDHMAWTNEQWRNILWTDESRFTLDFSDGRVRVRRKRGERYADCCIAQRDRYGGGSVMIWGGIWAAGKTTVVRIYGNLNALRYRDEIIIPIVLPIIEQHHIVFQQDNARPHTARIVKDCLETHDIHTLPWPSRSPDLSPIEHLWDELGRKVAERPAAPTTLDALAQCLADEWEAIPQETVENLVMSMSSRLEECCRRGGGHTRY